jgi:hypothetical protein
LAIKTTPWFDWVADPDFDVRIVRAFTWHLPEPVTVTGGCLRLKDETASIVIHGVFGRN